MSRSNLVGQMLGERYRVDQLVGRGGMSEVYKAYDPNLRRVVAIKTIHPHLTDEPKFISRFEEEAAAVAQLRHPNIVQVFDFNHTQDLYYMVQEFIPGETLQARLRRLSQAGRQMPIPEALQYTIQICDAAGYAHRRGMIHRDIKPANIMLDVNGQAILMDFGIVRITGSERHTTTGAVVGTALYMPPELIRSEPPDARSDIYSLGVTLFEMLSGRPPFEADSAMTLLMMHLNDPVPDLHQLRPEVSPALIAMVEKSLAKDREQRYGSMAEFAAELKRVLENPQADAAAMPTEVETPGAFWQGATLPEETGPALSAAQTAARPPAGAGALPPGVQAGTGASAAPPPGASGGVSPPRRLRLWGAVAGGLLLVAILAAIVAAFNLTPRLLNTGGPGEGTDALAALASPSAGAPAGLEASETPQPEPTWPPTGPPAATPTITLTPEPSLTPTTTLSPTPTIPAGVPFARINSISVDDQNRYVVDYETFEFTERLPGLHVHFFFNTVPPEEAGEPGSGARIYYGGPRPFTGYQTGNRPRHATQLCILVAEDHHTVRLDSGGCHLLPDIVAATAILGTPCLAGPGPEYPQTSQVAADQVVLVRGISSNESWWNVDRPDNPEESCWLPGSAVLINGDVSQVPLVEAPPPPTPQAAFSVEITEISIDEQNRYVVHYRVQGFTESLPGTHLHFFFDTVPPEQTGLLGGGDRLMYGGPTPFTGYSVQDRPAQARQLCVLVANPDHSVNPESGSCHPLPDV